LAARFQLITHTHTELQEIDEIVMHGHTASAIAIGLQFLSAAELKYTITAFPAYMRYTSLSMRVTDDSQQRICQCWTIHLSKIP